MKLPFTFIFLLLSISMLLMAEITYAQASNEVTTTDLRNLTSSNIVNTRQITETIGSPYPIEEFKNGVIFLANGKTSENLPIRYNAHKQTIEFKEGNNFFIIDPNQINEFEFRYDDSVYRYRKDFDASRLSEDQFVRLLIDDEVQFFVSHSKSLQKDIASYGSATKKDSYVDDVNYYLKVGDGELNRIRRFRKRHVMRNINSHKKEVEKYAEANNIKFSEPDDVEKLLIYYNSLLKSE